MRHLSKSGIVTLQALGGPIGSRTARVQEQQLEETKFIAFFMGKKIDIDGKDLYDAKQKAITQLKVPKSKVGLLAVVSAESQKNQDFRFESVNEGLKHLIHVETPKEIVSKSVASQIMALAKKGVRSNEIGLNMHFVGDEKAAVGAFQKVKNKIYFDLDTNESVNEGKKAFKINPPIGKAKYSISSHDGVSKHKDGSDFWDIEIFKNKVDLEKGIKNYSSKGFVKESLNEAASEEAKEIGALTGVRGDAVQKFIDDNNIHARKLLAYLKIKGLHTLSNRMYISTGIVGKPNNKFAQGIIKAFSEAVNEENPGLWANIRAKRERGEAPSPKNSKAYKDAVAAGKEINKEDIENVANGLPQTMGNEKSLKREALKSIVKEVMKEEAEYQKFFQKVMDKAGKSIPSMSDDEKKAFFNKVDSAWSARGEKNESTIKEEILKPGTKVKLRGGKPGKIVRYDGKTPGSPFYIVDIGQYYSLEVPAHEIRTESVIKEGIWPKSKLASPFQMQLSLELKKKFKGIFYSIGYDLYHNDKKILTIDGDNDSINSVIAKLKSKIR
jgi:hypothetical protein